MEKKLKILILSQYFWPENFRINEIAKHWSQKGYSVEVLTGYPNYPNGKIFSSFLKNKEKFNKLGKIKIYRCWMLARRGGSRFNIILNYLSFFLSALFFSILNLRKKNYDIILTFSISPVTISIISNILSYFTKSKTVNWILDLWPDVLSETGVIRSHFIINLLKKIVLNLYKHSDLLFTHSKSIQNEINNNFYDKKCKYLPSWPEEMQYNQKKFSALIKKNSKILTIIFTGSVGEYQNLHKISEVIGKLNNEKVRFIIVGGGRKRNDLQTFVRINNLKNIFFINNLSKKRIPSIINHADALLISLKSGKVGSFTVPGKFQTYLKFKKVILGHIGGETKHLIEKYRIGYVSNPDNYNNLKKNILKLIFLKESNRLNINTSNYKNINKIFNKNKILNYLDKEINSLIKKPKKIQIYTNNNILKFNKGFVMSGLNLAFLGYLFDKQVKVNNRMILWPDGLLSTFCKANLKKLSGKNLLAQLSLPKKIKTINVLGSLSSAGKKYLKKRFNKNISHYKLPYAKIDVILKKAKKIRLKKNCLVFLTLPTPKQEQVALELIKTKPLLSIFCLGGAINLSCGDEKPIPKFIEKYFEFIWRLRFDSKRRIKRLIVTLWHFSKGLIFKKLYYFKLRLL